MEVEVLVKEKRIIQIDSAEAFKILCRTLHMDFVLADKDFYICKDQYGEKTVWLNGEKYDDRGNLYESLCAVAYCMFPGSYMPKVIEEEMEIK